MSLNVLSGVPQVCVISPLLFNVFINDIFKCTIISKIKLFADYCKIYNLSELHLVLQDVCCMLSTTYPVLLALGR